MEELAEILRDIFSDYAAYVKEAAKEFATPCGTCGGSGERKITHRDIVLALLKDVGAHTAFDPEAKCPTCFGAGAVYPAGLIEIRAAELAAMDYADRLSVKDPTHDAD